MSKNAILPLRYLVPFVVLILFCDAVFAGTYGENLRHDLKRGFKNILEAPAEIPIAIQDYHERAGWPYVRQGWGFLVGTVKMVPRLGSGVLDLVVAWIPGLQQGLPLKPEVLF